MELLTLSVSASALAPPALMLIVAFLCLSKTIPLKWLWKAFSILSLLALIATAISPLLQLLMPAVSEHRLWMDGVAINPVQSWMAILVQLLGTVIGIFSSRYLEGEHGQARYIAAFSGVLVFVHVLLLADHWVVLIFAWIMIGVMLQRLLCFYPERPFAVLAAHKKNIADRIADILLITAAGLAWFDIGSGSLSALFAYVAHSEVSLMLHISAVCLVLAVMIRTALFPVHGWLIQVMEAPTPVSALLHAGVINLAGFVLIRFAPLLQKVIVASWLLVIFGLLTALLAGLVMLTRTSIKIRLAWSTVAQMGFMILECGLGLYTLAAMHLLGHSFYKAHAFLSSSSIVHQYKLRLLRMTGKVSPTSLILAPVVSIGLILFVKYMLINSTWPWWWSVILALAWAPMLWTVSYDGKPHSVHFITGPMMIVILAVMASLLHHFPFGTTDIVNTQTGIFALIGMAVMYSMLVILKLKPSRISAFQRWSYAGFYVDEAYTRLALKLWPINWASSQPLSNKS